MQPNHSRLNAIVLGGSIAGLLAARVLSAHYAQVTIIERDPVNDWPESRKGQPQTRHLHALLAGGLRILTGYFPDLPGALVAHGAVMHDMGESMWWYTHGGYRRPVHLGMEGVSMSRPLLECLVRRRVLALPNVTLRDHCEVKQLLASPDGTRVTGVMVEQRTPVAQVERLEADLLVDCTGRGSRTPQWLVELGYSAPPISEVKVNVAYATRLYRRDPTDPRGRQWTTITPQAPHETRFGAVFSIEGNRWIVSMGSWGGDNCPTDEEAYLEFARNLPAPDIYNIISESEPLSDIIPHKLVSSLRRHYEKLSRFPQGYLVLGDAIASINPTYGQGMTSAAMQAKELDGLLAQHTTPDRLARAFFKQAAKMVDISWNMAAGEDFRFATTTGPKPPGAGLLNRLAPKLERATHHDEVVCAAYLRVMNLLAPASSLLHPRILWRVLRQPPAHAQPAQLRPVMGD